MTNYLAFAPEPFSIELTYADLVKATKRAGAESVRISLRFEGNDTFEFKGPIRSDDFLVALATSAAIEADKHMDKVLAQVIEELTEAIRLSVEYVGPQKLRPRPGWSWFDALVKYAPHKAELFGPVFPDAPAPDEHATLDGHSTPDEWIKRANGAMPIRATHAGTHVPSTPLGGADGTFVGFETLADLKGPEHYTDTATGPGQDPEDKPVIEPNAMAVWASDTDERVIVYRWDTRPDGSFPNDPNRYVRGAFNKNGDFVTLDRLREIPDGYRKVNWGQDDKQADA